MSIFDTKARYWYKRIQSCVERYKKNDARQGSNRKVTQAEIVRRLESRFPKEKARPNLSQVNISRWFSSGGTGKWESTMPSMEVAIMLADFFGVDVGYLLGETNYDTFEMEKAVKYLGLDEKAISHIRLATKLESSFSSVHMLPDEAGEMISRFISSKGFFNLVMALKEFDRIYNEPDLQQKLQEDLEKRHGKKMLAKSMEFEPDEHEGEQIDVALREAYLDWQDAQDELYVDSMDKEVLVAAMRYRLSQSFEAIMDELYPK